MANFNMNKVILGGRLTADVEQKVTPNGTTVANFSIAVNRRGKDQPTDFINCVAFKERAEMICRYFKKGSSICVVGEMQTRNWTTDKGDKRYATEVIVGEVFFVDSKSDAEAPVAAPSAGYIPEAYTAAPKMVEVQDDDLPF